MELFFLVLIRFVFRVFKRFLSSGVFLFVICIWDIMVVVFV